MKAFELDWRRAVAEFLVIVVGVLVALAVDGWREERSNRILEGDYLRRLERDLTEADRFIEIGRGRLEGAELRGTWVLPYLRYGDPMATDTVSFLAQVFGASRSLWPSFVERYESATYLEPLASGRLGLITNGEIRSSLASYHRMLSAQTTDLLPTAYRDLVRSRLPVELQERFRRECPVTAAVERCQVDLGRFRPEPFLDELRGNQEVAGHLSLSLQQLRVVLSDLEALSASRATLLEMMRTEIDGH